MYLSYFILRPEDPESHLLQLLIEERGMEHSGMDRGERRVLVQGEPAMTIVDAPPRMTDEVLRNTAALRSEYEHLLPESGKGIIAIPVARDERFRIVRRTFTIALDHMARAEEQYRQATEQLAAGERLLGVSGVKHVKRLWRHVEETPADPQTLRYMIAQRDYSARITFLDVEALRAAGAQPADDGLPGYPDPEMASAALRLITSSPGETPPITGNRAVDYETPPTTYVIGVLVDTSDHHRNTPEQAIALTGGTPGSARHEEVAHLRGAAELAASRSRAIRRGENEKLDDLRPSLLGRLTSLAGAVEQYADVYEIEYAVVEPVDDATPIEGYAALRLDAEDPDQDDGSGWPVARMWRKDRRAWPRDHFADLREDPKTSDSRSTATGE